MALNPAIHVYRSGDGTQDGTEASDDGNSVNGDGCYEMCRVEHQRCGQAASTDSRYAVRLLALSRDRLASARRFFTGH